MSENKLAAQGFQIEDGVVTACNGIGLRNLLQSGQQWLQTHVDIVNSLNVFPVPDGDTGTNMVLTLRSALAKVEEVADHEVGIIAAVAAKGALMGARGNSGVILSQFLQGLAEGLKGQVTFTVADFAHATQLGAAQAYQGVIDPVEGTILTVARAVSDAAQQSAETTEDLVVLLTDVLAAAKIAQASTPSLLPVLKEAGVTDSGGQGLVYILEGGWRWLKNEPVDGDPAGLDVPAQVIPNVATPGVATPSVVEDTYGYDVQFLIQGAQLDIAEIRAYINSIGWSTLVVGDERLVKVHVHTHDPGIPISYGARQGIVSDVVVENLDEQARVFMHGDAEEESQDIVTIAVVPGPGLARIFQSLGVSQILSGGQTKNPSVEELLAAVNQVQADSVLILPNNPNVILAAQQSQSLTKKNVAVLSTQTIPQGIAALLSFNYQTDLETNVRRMSAAARQVQTIEVTQVVRDSDFNGFNIKTGDVIGLLDNQLVSAGQDYDDVSLDVFSQMDIDAYEIVTIYFGQDSSSGQANALARKISELYPDLEVEVHEGGQPHYQYIISLE
ncbi:DAK2 domain-containing protein [Chloroflexota bacterium]